MDRRRFLHSAAALGAAAMAGDGRGRIVAEAPDESGPVAAPDFELNEVTVAGLQDLMTKKRHTAKSVVELYLRRIDSLDRAGPGLRSIIEVNPDALQVATGLDAERRAGKLRGPLHGVPVLLKDVLDTADRMRTTAGSLALMGSTPPRDAFLVERLRAAGAVILGKTNLSEWSNARSPRSTAGWSARGGLTRNPYVLDRSACGSSSGTGVAIAANLATLGIGAETDGSISCPASANSLVGVRPTVGLWSRSGLIPLSFSIDTAGPMARTVTDAAILLGALTGVDGRDFATNASADYAQSDYVSTLDRKALQGARIGVLRRHLETGSGLNRLFDAALDVMRSEGATIVEEIEVPTIDEVPQYQAAVLVCEFKDAIREYLRTRGPEEKHRTLADLIRFNRENADLEMRWFGQESFEASDLTQGRESIEYRPALSRLRMLSRAMGIDRVMNENHLDAIVGIAASPPFTADLLFGDRSIVRNSSLSAAAGYPRVTVPGGFIHALPVGISFMGSAWSEARLLSLAFAFEQASKFRQPPHFLPTATLDK